MTQPIERVRYYDGEYLRAFDFQTEQEYHIEMRRRLNMGLHLHGIVEGMNVLTVVTGTVTTFSISSGFAIDPYGREIFLLAPYALDDSDLMTHNGVTHTGDYDMWLFYQRTAMTPPQDGYGSCDNSPELTRWQEGYRIVILPQSPPVSDPILPTDELPDDSGAGQRGVLLGVVNVGEDTGTLFITAISQKKCRYIGLRARSIRSPISGTRNFSLAPSHPRLHLADVVNVDPDGVAANNILIGDDFDASTAKPDSPPVAPKTFPNPTGNLKVSGDVFINGNLYLQGSTWQSLATYLSSTLLPETVCGTSTIQTSGVDPAALGFGVLNIDVPFTLAQIDVSRTVASAAISGFTFDPTDPKFNVVQKLDVKFLGPAGPVNTSNKTCRITFTWLAQPLTPSPGPPVGPPDTSPIRSITLAYTVVFRPKLP